MANVVTVGAQWGDEGKAKVVDLLAEAADVVIRSQGGCNAGHTVQHRGEVFKFHHLPSGLLYPEKTCVIGPGTVVSPMVLQQELRAIEERGYATTGLKVSSRAHLVMPYHVAQDQAQEAQRSDNKIGTTGRGIGPAYMDKVGRFGLRVGDLFGSWDLLRQRLEAVLSVKRLQLTGLSIAADALDCDALLSWCEQAKHILAPYACDTVPLLAEAATNGKHLLFEGAQGTLLDVDYGTYPYVTSSNASAGGACTGSGIGPSQIDESLGVMKAYLTRVGEGPFPTELTDTTGQYLAKRGNEVGTTTGRPRRCGWFDGVLARYSVQVNGLDTLAITKLDVLDELETVSVCVAYRHRQTGETTTTFPASLETLAAMEPVYETLPGWQQSTENAKSWNDLPAACQAYLRRLEAISGAAITIISVGPDREQTIVLRHPLARESRRQAEQSPTLLATLHKE